MTKDKEDEDALGLKDDKHNLGFIFDWNIRMKRFP